MVRSSGDGRGRGGGDRAISPFRRGTTGICRKCHRSVSSNSPRCPHCGTGSPGEASKIKQCGACHREVGTGARAQRHCVFHPERRPRVAILRAVVKSARDSGGDPERALLDTMRAACREP